MGKNICSQQFTFKNFGFRCKEDEKNLFFRSQWGSDRTLFFLYRLFMTLYSFGWLLAYMIVRGIYNIGALQRSYQYLTQWSNVMATIYFALACGLSIVGLVKNKRSNRTESGAIKFLRTLTWMIWTMSSLMILIVVITYWALLWKSESPENRRDPFNFHRHLVVAIMIVIDVFVAGFPIRLLHFVYGILIACLYSVMTVIVHAAGVNSAIYGFLNWAENPGLTAGIAVAFSVLGPILLHCFIFGLYCLRLQIYKCICPPDERVKQNVRAIAYSHADEHNGAVDNPAFDRDRFQEKIV
uniref:protein rolling stone-like n=1 Tax=Styela clava TaxID=7725 RepID=UPI0019398856|nr:protein rolling stone-like [Styela clava]